MKTPFKHSNQNAFCRTAIACLMFAGSITAYAIPAGQVGRTTAVQTIADSCVPDNCPGFLPVVGITEPATVTPVIVTWSADYNTTGTSVVGLSLNSGPCLFYGPFTLQEPQLNGEHNSITVATTHQWVVVPSDGLVPGKNTFHLCAGGYEIPQTINIGFSTLTVQSE